MRIINLLPADKKQELQYELYYRSLLRLFALSVVSFLLIFVVEVGTKIYLQQAEQAINSQIEQFEQTSSKEDDVLVKANIKSINNYITDFKLLSSQTPHWSRVLRAFTDQVPPGIILDSFTTDFTKKTITINGLSDTRDAVIELYNNIKQDDAEFYNIDYPLENVTQPTDISFHFTFNVKDRLLQ